MKSMGEHVHRLNFDQPVAVSQHRDISGQGSRIAGNVDNAINTQFKSQAGNLKERRNWRVSHQELRDDRAVFFLDHFSRGGMTLSYLARVTSAGEAIVPPAKVEKMYDPESFALSSSNHFKTPNPLTTASR